jgi:hypothetical protein
MNAPVSTDMVVLPSLGDQQELITEASGALELASTYVIDSPQMYELAGMELVQQKDQLRMLKEKCEEIADPYKEIKAKAEEGRKRTYNFFQPAIDRREQAVSVLTRAIAAYQDECKRIRAAAESAAAEEQRRITEAAEKKADKAEAKGDTAKAEQIRASVPTVAPPVNVPTAGKIAGISIRRPWKARLKGATESELNASKLALIKFVAANPQYINGLDINMKPWNDLAKSLEKNMAIDGLEAFEDIGSSSRK